MSPRTQIVKSFQGSILMENDQISNKQRILFLLVLVTGKYQNSCNIFTVQMRTRDDSLISHSKRLSRVQYYSLSNPLDILSYSARNSENIYKC